MNKKDRVLILISALLFILLVMTIFFIFQVQNKTSLRQESFELRKIEGFLEKGYRDEAERAIRALSRRDLSAVSHVRLLKSAWKFSLKSGEYRLLNECAERSYDAFPARSEITALYIFSLLRTGDTETAVSVYADSELDEEKWSDLATEMLLYIPKEPKDSSDSEGLPSKEEHLIGLSRESGPEHFLDFANRTKNPGFLQDALLLLLNRGEIERAYSLGPGRDFSSGEELSGKLPGELLFFIAYDAREWEAAYEYLADYFKNSTEIERGYLKADLHMRQSEYGEAAEVYRKILSGGTADQDTALYNLAWIDLTDDGTGQARVNLSELEPSVAVLYDLAEMMIADNRTAEAERIMSLLDSSQQGETQFKLLEEGMGHTVNPERYVSLLWRMVDQERYARYRGWFLIGLEDFSGLQSLVEIGEKKHGSTYWSLFFRGVINLSLGDYRRSAEEFLESYRRHRHWVSAYNAAVAYGADGQVREALNQLEKAELALKQGWNEDGEDEMDKEALASVLLKRAELLMFPRNFTAAEDVLNQIEGIAPSNLHADILRAMLVAEHDN